MQISIILIQRIDLLLKKTPKTDIKDHVMPLLYYALETPNAQVQQKALKALPQVMETLDYATIKASVYPRLEVPTERGKKHAKLKKIICRTCSHTLKCRRCA